MKKQVSLALAAVMAAGMLAACGGSSSSAAASSAASSEAGSTASAASNEAASGDALSADITLWTYPVGNFKDEASVNELIANFNQKYPGINVKVEYLDYSNGDD